MKSSAWLIPVLTTTVRLLRLADKPASAFGMLDAWGRLYPSKRLTFKTYELVVNDRLALNDSAR